MVLGLCYVQCKRASQMIAIVNETIDRDEEENGLGEGKGRGEGKR